MVVGNKTDIKDLRAVSASEGEMFASRNRMMFLETSAKNDEGVQEAFEEIARKVWRTMLISNIIGVLKVPYALVYFYNFAKFVYQTNIWTGEN